MLFCPQQCPCMCLQETGGENKASGWHPQRRPGRPGSPRVTAATVSERWWSELSSGTQRHQFSASQYYWPLRACPGTTCDEPDRFWVVSWWWSRWWPRWDLGYELFSLWFWADGSQPGAWRPRLCLQQHRSVVTLSFPGTRLLRGQRGSRSCLLFILHPSPSSARRLICCHPSE